MTPTRAPLRFVHAAPRRRGVTLIELLVVMAVITALGLLALMLLPGINNSDAALKATEEVRAQCKIAQALAAGARQPRGVRFLNQPGSRIATELQLLESPPITVIDPLALVAKAGNPTGVTGPYVELVYELYTGAPTDTSIDPIHASATPRPVPPAGTIKTRHCFLRGLTDEQRSQVVPGALLSLPVLGAWSRINTAIGARPNDEVVLEVYPDTFLGASTAYRTYHAGVYGAPVPLLGQPTIPLPKNIGVDLEISQPAIQSPALAGANYDVMFAPDGQTISIGTQSNNAGVYLWVRDITKTTNPAPVNGGTTTGMLRFHFASDAAWEDAFRRGGEQHAVGISNGFVGTAPIQWPPPGTVNGQYPAGTGDPFTFARKRLN